MGEDALGAAMQYDSKENTINFDGRTIKALTPEDKKSVAALAKYAGDNGFDFVYRVPLDITGAPQGFAHPTDYALKEGKVLGFDGSSLTGYQRIDESDMLSPLIPESAVVDISVDRPRLRVLARVKDPVTGEWYSRDPVSIAVKAWEYMRQLGVANHAYFGPEPEFFVFDKVLWRVTQNGAMYSFDSKEAWWNAATEGTGYQIRTKKGYAPLPPYDRFETFREDVMRALRFNGIIVETGHHEVATAGQGEIDMHFSGIEMAHQLTWYKHFMKNEAIKHGISATFMPKTILGDNGSGMHCHQSLWKGDGKNAVNLFADPEGYAGLSELALHYIGGILKHAPALCAITNPATVSYKRIVPHCEAPTNLVFSARNRSAAIRIPQYEPKNPAATRIEVRFPDPLASGHLAFAAMLMAGLDGIENKINPGKPFSGSVYEHDGDLPSLPAGGLEEAVRALEQDHGFLTKGSVFSEDFLKAWISLKREEIMYVNQGISPREVELYFGG